MDVTGHLDPEGAGAVDTPPEVRFDHGDELFSSRLPAFY